MEKPLNRSFRNFSQKVVTMITKMNRIGYRKVYSNPIAAVWGYSKASILVPTLNQSAKNARFSKNGVFPHKFTLSALLGNFEWFDVFFCELVRVLSYFHLMFAGVWLAPRALALM